MRGTLFSTNIRCQVFSMQPIKKEKTFTKYRYRFPCGSGPRLWGQQLRHLPVSEVLE
jgi:hypothetical protein